MSTVFIKKVIPKSQPEHSGNDESNASKPSQNLQASSQMAIAVKSTKVKEIKMVQDATKSLMKSAGANETPTTQQVGEYFIIIVVYFINTI